MTTKDLRSTDPLDVEEQGTCTYLADLAKDDGTPVAAGDLDFLRATLYDVVTRAAGGSDIIHGRDHQTILNANGGTFVAGHLTLVLGPLDNIIVTTDPVCPIGAIQKHLLLIEAEWNGGTGSKRWQKTVRVRNFDHVS